MLKELDSLFDQMIAQQRAKVLAIARGLLKDACPDDIMSPHDFPQLASDVRFNYEDGLLAGLLSAQMAVRADLKRREI